MGWTGRQIAELICMISRRYVLSKIFKKIISLVLWLALCVLLCVKP